MRIKNTLRKQILHLIGVLFYLQFISSCNNAISKTSENALRSESKLVPVIELTGDNYNRGLQHGSILKKEIAEVFTKWKMNIRETVKGDPDSTLSVFRNSTKFLPIIERTTPELLKEVRGIADGSGQTFEDVYAFQLLDEFWVYLNKQANIENHHCSGMGVPATANRPAYIAQNMDLQNYMHNYQVIFHLNANDIEPEQYLLSCAGLIGLNGMNANGIGLCVNTLMDLQASEDGLPVAFMIRAVVGKKIGEDAINFLQTTKHASGQNYILGIIDSVYNFEASANQVVRFLPKPGESTIVYHTNHAIVNHDVKEWYKKSHEQFLRGETKNKNSEVRYSALEERLNVDLDSITKDMIKATLRSKDNDKNPVCRPFTEKGGAFTFSSVLFTLGGKRSVQFTYGSPDNSEYQEYFFKTFK
ncbi:MAG: C45 family autoproteolytic acyltransferase/hydrolase [Chitinophagaceae bacterium]